MYGVWHAVFGVWFHDGGDLGEAMNQIVRQMEESGLIVDNTHLMGRLHLRTLAGCPHRAFRSPAWLRARDWLQIHQFGCNLFPRTLRILSLYARVDVEQLS